jgi:hypothetical protein
VLLSHRDRSRSCLNLVNVIYIIAVLHGKFISHMHITWPNSVSAFCHYCPICDVRDTVGGCITSIWKYGWDRVRIGFQFPLYAARSILSDSYKFKFGNPSELRFTLTQMSYNF